MKYLLLILSLPTENAAVRMRIWRALKASGAAVLRDGVYLMPETELCRMTLNAQAKDVCDAGGMALVLNTEEPEGSCFANLFDRGEDFAVLLVEISRAQGALTGGNVQETLRLVRKLRKSFTGLADIDFFPGEAQRQADNALQELEMACSRILSPDEPHMVIGTIPKLRISDYQQRVWATRRRPWVDRLACAWLIRRFIDPRAKFLWMSNPAECPAGAIGFDFDGATFSHVDNRVTFEVLLAGFSLEQEGLSRTGILVHYLDVGGAQPPEAAGVESILAGLRETFTDDEQLLNAACPIFDSLLLTYSKSASSDDKPGH
ncbi:chromate resistance protein ChrB domain-containing protein [Cronobacter sakazakii]|uniref:chromate resistance protein ChrB domain-containing protein n=1 Tax=Cronobacter sakazakii TaxID=28141 RepID=UPI000CFD5312|nr:chromate resistance protein ChrB domain-containing protein [Cronobacter sakazakii]HED2441183.1 chromate resistance protein [Citrobacter freundii]HED2466934.1 chromate resistance protein [Citrobacter freundii]HED2665482.1 chromate resistance protein [Citrobacter freundii]